MEKRLIRRQKLEIDPRYFVTATPESSTSYAPPESGHPIYAQIGEISMRWAFIEQLLDNCITTLADTDPQITACITAQMMGHVPRCLTIKALAHWRGLPDIVKAAESLQNSLHEVSELRNRAIHDRILIETKKKVPFKEHRMSKKDLQYGLKEFDPAVFKRAMELIDKRRQDCVNLGRLIESQVYVYYT